MDPVERASEILDINHGTIHNWTRIENDFRMHPFLPSNNIQFRPITYTLRKYSYPDVPVTVSGFPLRIVDNTIGGSLVVELGSDRPHFMAYSDLGDGNTRVIFDDNMPPPKLGRIPQKGFDSTIVTVRVPLPITGSTLITVPCGNLLISRYTNLIIITC